MILLHMAMLLIFLCSMQTALPAETNSSSHVINLLIASKADVQKRCPWSIPMEIEEITYISWCKTYIVKGKNPETKEKMLVSLYNNDPLNEPSYSCFLSLLGEQYKNLQGQNAQASERFARMIQEQHQQSKSA